jgi:hypothetical protein
MDHYVTKPELYASIARDRPEIRYGDTRRIRGRFAVTLAVMLATTSLSANAAVTYKGGSEDGSASIFITGDIVQGDAARFEGIISAMPEKKAMVFLSRRSRNQ